MPSVHYRSHGKKRYGKKARAKYMARTLLAKRVTAQTAPGGISYTVPRPLVGPSAYRYLKVTSRQQVNVGNSAITGGVVGPDIKVVAVAW